VSKYNPDAFTLRLMRCIDERGALILCLARLVDAIEGEPTPVYKSQALREARELLKKLDMEVR
jgi:hypothetical protein